MSGVRNILEVDNIKKIYKVTDIFDKIKGKKSKNGVKDISFNVKEGEVFSIVGLNGAGKTTVMKCILNLIEQDSGKVRIFGKKELETSDFEKIGYLPEISYYPKDIKYIDLLNYYGDLYGMEPVKKNKRIQDILKIMNLKGRENEKLKNFSKGMLQKVGISQAILNDPELLFLDEPMSGLDPVGRRLVRDIIYQLQSQNTTIILNTHILSDVEKLSDRIAILSEGEIKRIINYNSYESRETKFKVITDGFYEGSLRIGDKFINMVKEVELDTFIDKVKKEGLKIKSVEKELKSLETLFVEEVM